MHCPIILAWKVKIFTFESALHIAEDENMYTTRGTIEVPIYTGFRQVIDVIFYSDLGSAETQKRLSWTEENEPSELWKSRICFSCWCKLELVWPAKWCHFILLIKGDIMRLHHFKTEKDVSLSFLDFLGCKQHQVQQEQPWKKKKVTRRTVLR